jgi:hypothetical protein
MKILHVYRTYFPETFGGVEQVIASLAKHALKDGITVHRVKANLKLASTPLSFKAFRKYKKLARQFDLVHYHFPYTFMDILHFFETERS